MNVERRVDGVVVGELGEGTIYKQAAPANFFPSASAGPASTCFTAKKRFTG